MRTKTLLIAAVLGAVSIATTSAQVTSANAVGYVNIELSPGFNLISNPLSNGENKVSEVIPNAPEGATIFKFTGDGYMDISFGFGVWSNPDLELPVGVGFFLQNPGTEAVTVTFIGEVLQGDATNKTVPEGLSIQGSLVPQAGALAEDLGFPAADGDTVHVWNGTGWDSNTVGFGAFSPSEPTLSVGDAVFVDKASAGQWDRNFTIN